MSKGKKKKFAELATFQNAFQSFDPLHPRLKNCKNEYVDLKGQWKVQYFQNEGPLILELACGKGAYTVSLARKNPDRNYIGADIKGNRIWKGARIALEEGLKNVAFIRISIENLTHFFAENEVDEIWITFPDPFPRRTRARKRLTSPRFQKLYRNVLKPGGVVHLKTDSDLLYEFTREVIRKEGLTLVEDIPDIYSLADPPPDLTIQTHYEQMHLQEGRTIKYLRYKYDS